jgi:hypothetical protein
VTHAWVMARLCVARARVYSAAAYSASVNRRFPYWREDRAEHMRRVVDHLVEAQEWREKAKEGRK